MMELHMKAMSYIEHVIQVELPLFEATRDHGPCWVCGAKAVEQCDKPLGAGTMYDPYCDRWLCDAHLVIEAQSWDHTGTDGVDFRCQEHRNFTAAVRDWYRGSAMPPADLGY